jgi:hypothetical protein
LTAMPPGKTSPFAGAGVEIELHHPARRLLKASKHLHSP